MKKLTESVWNFLVDEGFRPTDKYEYFVFDCKGRTFIYDKNEDDEYYFQLILPNIYKFDEETKLDVLNEINRINSEYKVVKACFSQNNNVYLCVEVFMNADSNIKPVFQRSLYVMMQAYHSFMSEKKIVSDKNS